MRTYFALMTAAVATTVLAEEQPAITLDSALPVVVNTVPAAGSDDVDPDLGSIRVTFSKKMRDGS